MDVSSRDAKVGMSQRWGWGGTGVVRAGVKQQEVLTLSESLSDRALRR